MVSSSIPSGKLATSTSLVPVLDFLLLNIQCCSIFCFQDQANNLTTRTFVDVKMGPELMELINKYRPEVLWSDGDWEVGDDIC